jgi:hypothetical protein
MSSCTAKRNSAQKVRFHGERGHETLRGDLEVYRAGAAHDFDQ